MGREGIVTVDKNNEFEPVYKRKYKNSCIQRQFENKLLGRGNFVPGKTDLVSYVLQCYDTKLYLD